MSEQRVNVHTVSKLSVHIIWSSKYRDAILLGDIQKALSFDSYIGI